jgi:hypothetical protein
MWHPGMHTNMNFPAPLAMAGIGAAFVGTLFAVALMSLSLITRQRTILRWTCRLFAACVVIYILLIFGFSLGSRNEVLARGREKYFCEVDCHLAYSVLDVKQQPAPAGMRYTVTVSTRFDETTIASWRPRDVPLRPSPRSVQLIDAQGHRYGLDSSSGIPLNTDLIPGQSYTSDLSFVVPAGASGLRLLIGSVGGWPDKLVIGDENSWLHKKTYFAI